MASELLYFLLLSADLEAGKKAFYQRQQQEGTNLLGFNSILSSATYSSPAPLSREIHYFLLYNYIIAHVIESAMIDEVYVRIALNV